MDKPFVSESMKSGRILTHGKIVELPFSLGTVPFSIFIIPKTQPEAVVPVLVNCKLILDDESANCPFNINQWTEPAIISLPSDSIDLTLNDVYWGSDSDVAES